VNGRTEKLRILFVQPTALFGGIERILLSTVRLLDRARYEPHVVCLERGALVQMLRDVGARTSVLPITHLRKPANTAMTVLRLAHYIRRHGIHVVHCNGQKSQIYGSLAAMLAGVPCVYWLHHIPAPGLGQDLLGDIAFLLPAAVRLTNSTAANDAALRHPLVRRAPRVLWYGLELEQFGAGAAGERDARAAACPHVLCIGRIQPWKGQHVLVQAAAELKRAGRDLRISIVGSPSFAADAAYYQLLKDMVLSLGLHAMVRFVPHTSDVVAWYRQSDIVVHTSVEPEPFGLVLIEALACGRPVIATNAGGPLDITDHGRIGGLLVPPGDAQALARAISTLLDDPDLALRLGREGRTRVRQLYSARRMVDELQMVYEGIRR
jgi:glycosyltransferase involved in cell wall biosynthesis